MMFHHYQVPGQIQGRNVMPQEVPQRKRKRMYMTETNFENDPHGLAWDDAEYVPPTKKKMPHGYKTQPHIPSVPRLNMLACGNCGQHTQLTSMIRSQVTPERLICITCAGFERMYGHQKIGQQPVYTSESGSYNGTEGMSSGLTAHQQFYAMSGQMPQKSEGSSYQMNASGKEDGDFMLSFAPPPALEVPSSKLQIPSVDLRPQATKKRKHTHTVEYLRRQNVFPTQRHRFSPGRLGLVGYWDMGIVQRVEAFTQGSVKGIKPGWRMVRLNDQVYNRATLDFLRQGPEDYVITFNTDTQHNNYLLSRHTQREPVKCEYCIQYSERSKQKYLRIGEHHFRVCRDCFLYEQKFGTIGKILSERVTQGAKAPAPPAVKAAPPAKVTVKQEADPVKQQAAPAAPVKMENFDASASADGSGNTATNSSTRTNSEIGENDKTNQDSVSECFL